MPDEFIRQRGDPELYERAHAVTAFDDLLRARAARLRRRLEEAGGAGLAATQVGWLRRIFAFRLSHEDETEVLVNPRVLWRSEQYDCEDFAASLMQHEVDHLDGILTLHRADRAERYRAVTALLAETADEAPMAA
jgi:peptide deformylase